MRIGNGGESGNMFVGNSQQKKKDTNDTVSKNIQQQISQAKQQLEQISGNKNLTAEEKKNKTKEIKQQIADLTKQLSDRQMEVKKQEQAEQNEMMQEAQNKMKVPQESDQNRANNEMVQNFIAAGTALSNASSLSQTRARMNGQKNNLASEIETDAGRGMDVSKKQENLADMDRRINNITKQIGQEYSKVNDEMKKDKEKGTKETLETEDDKEKDKKAKQSENNADASDPRHGNPAIDILS